MSLNDKMILGQGMTSLMSQEGLNQLNIFIFVLAALQIISSVTTMGLGRAKVHLHLHCIISSFLLELWSFFLTSRKICYQNRNQKTKIYNDNS